MCTSWSHEKGPEKLIRRLSGQRALILNLRLHQYFQPSRIPVSELGGGGEGNCCKPSRLVWWEHSIWGEKMNIFSNASGLLSGLRIGGETTENHRSESGAPPSSSSSNNNNTTVIIIISDCWLSTIIPTNGQLSLKSSKIYPQTTLLHMLGSLMF